MSAVRCTHRTRTASLLYGAEKRHCLPMLRASSRWKPRRSATTNAHPIIMGARLITVNLSLIAYRKRGKPRSQPQFNTPVESMYHSRKYMHWRHIARIPDFPKGFALDAPLRREPH